MNWGYSPELRQLTYRDPSDSTGHRRLGPLPSFGGIGLSGSKRSALSLAVVQRVHARWKLGSRVIKQENILNLSTSSSPMTFSPNRSRDRHARGDSRR